jgi:hypothetical protein
MSQDAPPAPTLPSAVRETVDSFSLLAEVDAIALGGSRVVGEADSFSDYDVYVYTSGVIPLDVRRTLAERYDALPEISNTWFGEEDSWTDTACGVAIELMYWKRGWIEAALRDVMEGHRASLGYSTTHWYTVRNSTLLFDRDGWFRGLQEAARRPYPEGLRHAIISLNHPLLRTTHASYRHQIVLAIERDDPVGVQHRVTALLTSVFDIVFAAHRALHPGEKRQLSHVAQLDVGGSQRFAREVRELIQAASTSERGSILRAIDVLCDDVESIINSTNAAGGSQWRHECHTGWRG